MLGISLLVDPTSAVTSVFTASGSSGAVGQGVVHMPVPIPNQTALVGAEFFAQVLALDVGAANGDFSATQGLWLVVCP